MKEHLVYLAGPVSGLRFDGCSSWREYAAGRLEHAGPIKTLSPLRGKEALKDESILLPSGYGGQASDKVIFEMCRWDVRRADIVLCNLIGAADKSLGTTFEMAWAYAWGKYIVTAMEDNGNPHHHAFVREASSIILPSLDSAIDYILKVSLK